MASFQFRLFVTGKHPRSRSAIRHIEEALRAYPGLHLEVIDVLERPDLAESHRILATPALVRLLPLPSLRVVGDMSDPHIIERLFDISTNGRVS